VRGEQAGRDGHRVFRLEPSRDAQHLRLVLKIEPVAGLDLDRRDAFLQQRSQAWPALPQQVVLGRGARGAHGAEDAAALAGNCGIALARGAAREFRGALPGEDEVRVAVDESGREPSSCKLDRPFRADAGRDVALGTHPLDRRAARHHGAAGVHASGFVAGCDAGIAPESEHGKRFVTSGWRLGSKGW
jgi:hypothetical protein